MLPVVTEQRSQACPCEQSDEHGCFCTPATPNLEANLGPAGLSQGLVLRSLKNAHLHASADVLLNRLHDILKRSIAQLF